MRTFQNLWSAFPALLVAVGLKSWLILSGKVPFNSDEAVVALMARHILQGERPVFFYGQAYMGSLDAWLVAAAFRLFGEQVAALRLVQVVLYLAFMVSLWVLARRFFRDPLVGDLAVWIAAVPILLLTTYTTASLGGYSEILVLGNLILWLGYEIALGKWQALRGAWLALGLLGGLAFWTLGLAAVYLVPVALFILWRFRFEKLPLYGLALSGFVFGSFPFWAGNFLQGGAALAVLTRSAPQSTTPVEHLAGLVLLGIPALLGLRPPWSTTFASWPVLLAGLVLYLGGAAYWLRGFRRGRPELVPGAFRLLGLFGLAFTTVFLFTRFGVDATGRYLLPLCLLIILGMAAFCAAAWRWKPQAGIALLALVLAINGIETGRAAWSQEKITTQFSPITRSDNQHDAKLIAFLRQHGETRGYTNYWVSFRLAFLSGEELIYSPELPYRENLLYSSTDNRYPAYARMAAESPQAAYITARHPVLDDLLRRRFAELGVTSQEAQIGDYHVFYRLSRTVRPGEIGLWRNP